MFRTTFIVTLAPCSIDEQLSTAPTSAGGAGSGGGRCVCRAGRYLASDSSHGGSGGGSCLPCAAGTFAANPGALACTPCPGSAVAIRGSAACAPCPPFSRAGGAGDRCVCFEGYSPQYTHSTQHGNASLAIAPAAPTGGGGGGAGGGNGGGIGGGSGAVGMGMRCLPCPRGVLCAENEVVTAAGFWCAVGCGIQSGQIGIRQLLSVLDIGECLFCVSVSAGGSPRTRSSFTNASLGFVPHPSPPLPQDANDHTQFSIIQSCRVITSVPFSFD